MFKEMSQPINVLVNKCNVFWVKTGGLIRLSHWYDANRLLDKTNKYPDSFRLLNSEIFIVPENIISESLPQSGRRR